MNAPYVIERQAAPSLGYRIRFEMQAITSALRQIDAGRIDLARKTLDASHARMRNSIEKE